MGRLRKTNTHLPPRMLFKHGAYYWTPRVDGRQTFQPLGRDYPVALENYYQLEGIPRSARTVWRLPSPRSPKEDTRNWKKRLYYQAQARAKSRGVEFLMTFVEFTQLVTLADGRCQITKIPFEIRFAEGERRRPWAPSVDRIDSRQGYTLDNCRLVCVAVNLGMQNWGVDVLLTIGRALKEQRLI